MRNLQKVLASILLLGLPLLGCRRLQGVVHKEVDATLAPTSVPLPAASAAGDKTPPPSPTDTAAPSAPSSVPPTTTPVPSTPVNTETASPAPTPSQMATSTATAVAATGQPPPSTQVVAPPEAIRLPPGFGISVFIQDLQGPRMMAIGPDGHLYAAERGAGRIVRLPDRDGNGLADGVETVAEGLSAPSSIVFFRDGSLYVAETTRVLQLSSPGPDGVLTKTKVIIDDLPSGGHNTRTILFSPDWRWLYVSIGSSCNVCVEEDERRAAIVRYTPEGTFEHVYARGLRNAVGITFRPATDEIWATNNGRDWLGDDQPPETVYLVRDGMDAGWPRCHSGRIVDPDLGAPDACKGVSSPAVEMQAHSAPLGLTFYDGEQFPAEYRGNLFVAFHGSWNRSSPTGYRIVRIPIQGSQPGPVYDFASGWLRENGSSWGRPVDVVTGPEGSLFVSDDAGGRIYRIYYSHR